MSLWHTGKNQLTARRLKIPGPRKTLGRVAIVVVPWSDPLFMERSLTQQFGQQERSNFFGSV